MKALSWLLPILLFSTPQIVPAQFRIHEVLYDGDGTDADDAFTEIVGTPGFSLDGWRLVGINGGNGEVYRDLDLTGAVIPADSLLVIATSNAAGAVLEVRDFTANVDWQNGPDAVQLRDSTGAAIDALQYGDAGAFNSGEGVSANSVSAGKSLSRDRSSSDSDDNAADFSPLNPPTPGSLSGNELRLSIPDTSAAYNDTLIVPLRLSGTSGRGILAAEVFVSFDGGLLSADSANTTPMSDGWTVVFNRVAGSDGPVDTLKIAMATDVDTLEGGSDLVAVRFVVSDHRRPAATAIVLEHAVFNDGSVEPILVDGQVSIIGSNAVLTVLPTAPLDPPDDLYFELIDMDESRDVLVADTLMIRVDGDSQVEVLTAVETGANTGLFRGSLPVIIGSSLSNNGVFEVVPDEALTFCHDDSLTADGQTLERCAVGTVAAHDGQLSATSVAEPGDTLRVQLIDQDLNADPATTEMLQLYAINSTSPDTERVTLIEASLDDSVFVAVVPTSAALATSGDSLVSVIGGDAISITYDDEHRTSGDPVTVLDTSFVVALFGDADRNGLLQAFDAAAVLSHVLSPLANIDSLAANVDSSAPEGAITPFDAALILQHRVGMRQRFPVQESGSSNHPRVDAQDPVSKPLVQRSILEPRVETEYVSIWAEDRSQIISGEVSIEGVVGQVQAAVDLSHFLIAFRPFDGGVRIVMAGASPVPGPGELLRIYPSKPVSAVRILGGSFNDGQITVPVLKDPPAATPTSFALHPNYPNPFNPETTIDFDLPNSAHTRLEVFDVAGQRQRILLAGRMAGGRHRVAWDGRDDGGRRVSSGVYLYRLQSGASDETRRMVLLK